MIAARTIGGGLLRAFLVLAVLLAGAGVIAYNSLHTSAASAAAALDVIRRDARLSSELSAALAEEMPTTLFAFASPRPVRVLPDVPNTFAKI